MCSSWLSIFSCLSSGYIRFAHTNVVKVFNAPSHVFIIREGDLRQAILVRSILMECIPHSPWNLTTHPLKREFQINKDLFHLLLFGHWVNNKNSVSINFNYIYTYIPIIYSKWVDKQATKCKHQQDKVIPDTWARWWHIFRSVQILFKCFIIRTMNVIHLHSIISNLFSTTLIWRIMQKKVNIKRTKV